MLLPGASIAQSGILVAICARFVSGTNSRTPNELRHFPLGIVEYLHECPNREPDADCEDARKM